MAEDSVAGFRFPAVCRKKVAAAFDGGRLTSDGGVLLLAQAERAMGIAGHLAGCIARDQSRVVHGVADITATGRPVAMLLRTGKTPSVAGSPAMSAGCTGVSRSAGPTPR